MLRALHRSRRRSAAFGGSLLAGGSNLERLAFKRRNSGSSLKSFNRLNGRGCRYRFRDMDGRRNDAAVGRGRRIHFAALGRLRPAELGLDRRNVVVLLEMFQKIADVQEGVAIEADIHEGRLHARKNSGDAAFVKTSD